MDQICEENGRNVILYLCHSFTVAEFSQGIIWATLCADSHPLRLHNTGFAYNNNTRYPMS